MRAADLIALATAHGIDLTQAAKQATQLNSKRSWLLRTKFRHRLETSADTGLEPPTHSAIGRQSHVTTQREWSMAELGQAAQGVGRIQFFAAMYAYAGDRSC